MISSDQQIVNQYFKLIKSSGYKYWKDKMGFYFERGIVRFSVIKVGPFLDVYFNKKEDGIYRLQEKKTGLLSTMDALFWIYERSRINYDN